MASYDPTISTPYPIRPAHSRARDEQARRNDLAGWLRRSDAYDVLDDAVMGSLTVATVLDLLGDFDLDDTAEQRAWFRAELDRALSEGN